MLISTLILAKSIQMAKLKVIILNRNNF